MKVLFLDIDGVLNNNETTERCNNFTGVDRKLAKRFTDWLNTTDVKIVLSSTWRLHPEMWFALNEAGISWIDVTPGPHRYRGDDIKQWLDAHPEVTAYAILDDSTDMLPSQFDRCVFTDGSHGLQDWDIEKLRILFKE